MGKGANKELMGNSGLAKQQFGTKTGQSDAMYGFLDPTLKAEATNPQGYTPTQMSAFNTASQESAGGSNAGVTGQANLEAARTNNAGGFQGAIASGSRASSRELAENALKVQMDQANLQQAQKQQALSSLQQLYGVDSSTALNYLNSSSNSLTEENKSHPVQQGIQTAGGLISNLSGSAASGAGAFKALGG